MQQLGPRAESGVRGLQAAAGAEGCENVIWRVGRRQLRSYVATRQTFVPHFHTFDFIHRHTHAIAREIETCLPASL